MKVILNTILIFCLTNSLAQSEPIPFQKNGKWGLFSVNTDKSKSIIAEPKFDSIGIFNGALHTIIVQENKWGVINRNGVVKVAPVYPHAKLLFNGEVVVLEKIAPDQQFIVYQLVQDFAIFTTYDKVKEVTSEVATYTHHLTGKKVVFNKTGKVISEGEYDEVEAQALFSLDIVSPSQLNSSNSFIICKAYYKDKHGHLGHGAPKNVLLLFFDDTGNQIQIPLRTYSFNRDFRNDSISLITGGNANGESISVIVDRKDQGLRIKTVKMSLSYKQSFPFGFVIHNGDSIGTSTFDGKELIPPRYRVVSMLTDSLYMLLRDFQNNPDLRTISGKTVIPEGYRFTDSRLINQQERLIILTDAKDKQHLYKMETENLKFLRSIKKERVHAIINSNYFISKGGENYGVFNADGMKVIPKKFRQVRHFRDFGFVCEDAHANFYLYDLEGNRKFESFVFNSWSTGGYDQQTGLSTMKSPVIILRDTAGFYGLINNNFELILPFKYEQMRFFSDSIVWAVNDETKENLLYDLQGNRISQFDFSRSIGRTQRLYFFEQGTKENLKRIIVDGRTLRVNGIYDHLTFKKEGPILCWKNGFWGIVNQEGKEVTPFVFDKIVETEDPNLCIVIKEDICALFNIATEDFVFDFSHNLENITLIPQTEHFFVSRGNKQGVWSSNGEVIVPIQDGEIEKIQGLYRLIKNGQILAYYTYEGITF